MAETILRTPLHQQHLESGARMVPFAGYELPVQYKSIIMESKVVRTSVGMFDVSHMARLWLHGERTLEFLELVTSNDVAKLEDGKGQYSLLPNDRGGIVDDIIVYRLHPDTFRMVVNASNHQKDVDWLRAQNTFGIEIVDQTEETAMIAVQGPKASATVAKLSDNANDLQAAPAFGIVECEIGGVGCFAARSGYTGEDGFELICQAGDAPALWNALLDEGVEPCGLGARDTLRVEAGLPLYGHELGDEMSPIAAGLGWVISKTKTFIGSKQINEDRETGVPRKLQGVRLATKRLPMAEMPLFVDGKQVGEMTSGVYSPVLYAGIGFAFVDSDVALETPCEVDVRGKLEPGVIVSKRFYKRQK